MSVSKIQHHIFNQPYKNDVVHLKEGQIVEGKIMQIYPDNRAKVRIGSTTLIAQIETALSVGESYYFQVSEANEQIYLQVVQADGKNQPANLDALMAQLQLKGTKSNRQLLASLIALGIPFNRSQLEQAVVILQKQPKKMAAMDVLQQMLQAKLPITENVFQALSTFHSNQFTPMLESVYNALEHTATPKSDNEVALMQLIKSFIERPETSDVKYSRMVLEQVKQDSALFTMYRMLGMFDAGLKQEEVISRLENYLQSKSASTFPLQQVQSQAQLQQFIAQTNHDLHSLLQEEQTINRTALKIMSIYHPIQSTSLHHQELTSLIKMVEQELLPLIPEAMKRQITELLQRATVDDQAPLLNLLRTLTNKNMYSALANLEQLVGQQAADKSQQIPVQQQLLVQLSHYMESVGLTMEKDFIQALQALQQDGEQETMIQPQTIKSLLLQMIQQGSQQEQAQQLVHFMNGLQLQSVTETNQLLQAQLVIPGNPFALNEDIFMQFESKKTADEQIDTDYCRIMFVLHLEQLRETIVDMQIQKRIITVTIFNDVASHMDSMGAIRNEMKTNLQQLNYQLSTVDWKPLSDKKEAVIPKTSQQMSAHQQEGYDFRI